jgi:hypothetical protein
MNVPATSEHLDRVRSGAAAKIDRDAGRSLLRGEEIQRPLEQFPMRASGRHGESRSSRSGLQET